MILCYWILFSVNFKCSEHFAVLPKTRVSTEIGTIYICLKIFSLVWWCGSLAMGNLLAWNLVPRWNSLERLTCMGSA
jgi:hypothetical protein